MLFAPFVVIIPAQNPVEKCSKLVDYWTAAKWRPHRNIMHITNISSWQHRHEFCGEFARAEKNTRRVLALTGVMMVVEIIGGLKLHSMALFADGCHMAIYRGPRTKNAAVLQGTSSATRRIGASDCGGESLHGG